MLYITLPNSGDLRWHDVAVDETDDLTNSVSSFSRQNLLSNDFKLELGDARCTVCELMLNTGKNKLSDTSLLH